MSTNLPNRVGQQQEKMDRLSDENARLKEEVSALVKWINDRADGSVKYSAAELRVLERRLSPSEKPAIRRPAPTPRRRK